MKMVDMINQIGQASRTDWKFKVRIVRLWSVPDYQNSKEEATIEMVIMDEMGGRIHATIKRSLISKYKQTICEGHTYSMSNFVVGHNDGKFRSTKHKYKLNFTSRTCIVECTSMMILDEGFLFLSFTDIASISEETYLIDVIGHVVQRDNIVENFANGRNTKRLNIVLEDLENNRLNCTFWGSASYLRSLFATLLLSSSISRPKFVWEHTWTCLSDDILNRQRILLQHQGLQLTDNELKNYVLAELENLLRSNGKNLADYPQMPLPDRDFLSHTQNRLIYDELNYDRSSLTIEFHNLLSRLTDEQRGVYHTIMDAVEQNKSGLFFVYGYGGTGKTFIWKTLCAALRSKGEIVIAVASSGKASLLIPGGRTAHSRFLIPLNPNEDSTCNIRQGTPLAELIIKTSLIIWDEAPMVHKYCFEALDRTLRDILRFKNTQSAEQPFGGKIVVLGGDFRQILPVIPKGSRQDIVMASINSSYLWKYCTVLNLTKNMRLETGFSNSDITELKDFSEWILQIGDGNIGNNIDGDGMIEIPDNLLIKDTESPIASIVESIYPSFLLNIQDPLYLHERAILAPTHDVVDLVNEYMLSLMSGDEKIYLSFDSICKSDCSADNLHDIHTPEYLNSIKCSGVPNHELKLKVGVPVMLLRNIDQSLGLCNGTRLVTTQLGKHVIEAKVISGVCEGNKVLIPRMSLSPSDTRIPFKFQRRQYPLALSFAMTINKSQGQSLSHVGLYLRRPVFSHG